MVKVKKVSQLLIVIALTSALLVACGNPSNNAAEKAVPTKETVELATAEPEKTESATQLYKDWSGHEVNIPTNPQRVIFHGEVTGDIFALGVTPVGVLKQSGTSYDELLKPIEDVGFPINLEKSLGLKPDLIIFSNSDADQYEKLTKIAPTVTYDSFSPLKDRLTELGVILGKETEAAAWLQKYHTDRDAMWAELRKEEVKENETATVFTMYPGNRLFVMAGAGLPQFLYEEGGFKPVAGVQKLIDEATGFLEISTETIGDYAGDRIFILNPTDASAEEETEAMMKTSLWSSLPAVEKGYVYNFDIEKASGDALARTWMLEELPKALNK
ncbi:ABC transporter substrate-binding protein [Paenibacillus sp. GSMTC-2017]|uniref:ABC transporter substrate-binding protein n=1 Tax=Paenibacillus sp. GSMTC-2017 TaxID=2794350 RepID=UPI0018D8166C|nr:ABC transporter substrate-binding protein [Paenibacillus sp. GSMTC-2017]MBH5318836.1 ABC transporter substrate-binding protein [Paenibacillus sp. GSMTC-2017]